MTDRLPTDRLQANSLPRPQRLEDVDDGVTDELESRLRVDAERMLELSSGQAIGSAWTLVRRRREKRMTAGVAGTLLLLLALGVGMAFRASDKPRHDTHLSEPSHRGGSLEGQPTTKLAAETDGIRPVDQEKALAEAMAALATGATVQGTPVVPGALTVEGKIVALGFYTPPQVTEVRFDELTRGEQQAVRRLMGVDGHPWGPY